MTRGNIAMELAQMIPAPNASVSTAVVQVMFRTNDGILMCYGSGSATILEDATIKVAPGCLYIKVENNSTTTSVWYKNSGTVASCVMAPVAS